MSSRPASVAETRPALSLADHIEELRLELASVLCPKERRQIEEELRAARAALENLKVLNGGRPLRRPHRP